MKKWLTVLIVSASTALILLHSMYFNVGKAEIALSQLDNSALTYSLTERFINWFTPDVIFFCTVILLLIVWFKPLKKKIMARFILSLCIAPLLIS